MFATFSGRTLVAFAMGLGLVFLGAACGQDGDGSDATTDETPTMTGETPTLPAELTDPQATPDAETLLPQLEEYTTDDRPDPGEIEASLDHSSVPYVDVRRRLILDEQEFTVGEVTVVTVEPGSGGGEAYLDHRYGDAARTPVDVAGVEMLRVETDPYDAIAWAEPT